ncbi:cob(I)yrinic acid a,c-diamide adenosyltransferase [Fusibacter tunisiensis]|jgi:cob(I)alamin adenosyltransferase|uniref:Corrinoid adenosyltransferase n=1 Tax=Fusibacter tunisiensis TaxID=1008308 RepID=A0ABS2MNT0_9FIRM|nr:cob(I)yrinic acid a,c-diamide adenosyltransferase [Fusibacter tunisiensis]MBM7561048.1 cob(I)alamin adenosyltransferase [Fusibacter tunisiensis]
MLKIYTKTGDKGSTSLYDGTRVPKDSIRVESYGTIDELNSSLGLSRNYCQDSEIKEILFKIQRSLFNVAGELATQDSEAFPERVSETDTQWLEWIIDHYLDQMNRDEVFQFIIPGSNLFSASMHVSRTVCRRAERRILTLAEEAPIRSELIKYVNRLSDAIYTMARFSETELHKVDFKK